MKTGSSRGNTDVPARSTAWFTNSTHAAIRMTDAESHSTRYGYDDSGHLTEVILADGRTADDQSDARQAGEHQPDGRITRWQRDGRAGRSRTDAMGRRTAFGHHVMGVLVMLRTRTENATGSATTCWTVAEQINPCTLPPGVPLQRAERGHGKAGVHRGPGRRTPPAGA